MAMAEMLLEEQKLPQPYESHLQDLPPQVIKGFAESYHVLEGENPSVQVFDFGEERLFGMLTGDLAGESNMYVIDFDLAGSKIGEGSFGRDARFPKNGTTEMPSVIWTETEESRRGEGLGPRRLRVMNELSRMYYHEPLESSAEGDTEPEAARVWQKLVLEGEAEKISEEPDRWRFLTSHEK